MVSQIVTLEVEGIRIVGQIYLPDSDAPHPIVCICHGIPAKTPEPGDGGYPLLAERICRQGLAAFIFNFRGTGASGGNFDIMGWTRDLAAAIDYLCTLSEVDESRLFLLGFSGGAAVSVYVAAQDKRVSSVVTCACPAEFTFLSELDKPQSVIDHFRDIGVIRDEAFPPSIDEWLNGFGLISPIEYVAGIAPRPLFIVHGNQDTTVDISHAHRLYERVGEPKQLVVVEGAGHRLRQDERAMAIVVDWLKSQAHISN